MNINRNNHENQYEDLIVLDENVMNPVPENLVKLLPTS